MFGNIEQASGLTNGAFSPICAAAFAWKKSRSPSRSIGRTELSSVVAHFLGHKVDPAYVMVLHDIATPTQVASGADRSPSIVEESFLSSRSYIRRMALIQNGVDPTFPMSARHLPEYEAATKVLTSCHRAVVQLAQWAVKECRRCGLIGVTKTWFTTTKGKVVPLCKACRKVQAPSSFPIYSLRAMDAIDEIHGHPLNGWLNLAQSLKEAENLEDAQRIFRVSVFLAAQKEVPPDLVEQSLHLVLPTPEY